jgi:hypothetical protein
MLLLLPDEDDGDLQGILLGQLEQHLKVLAQLCRMQHVVCVMDDEVINIVTDHLASGDFIRDLTRHVSWRGDDMLDVVVTLVIHVLGEKRVIIIVGGLGTQLHS